MAGLLDGYGVDPIAQGLLGAAQGLLTPRAYGGGVGAAMGGFNQGAMQAQELLRKRQQDAMREQLMQAQIRKFNADVSEEERKAATQKQLQDAARGAYTPAMPGVGDENNPYVPVPGTPARFDAQKFIAGIAQVAPLEAMKYIESQKKDNPLAKIDPKDYDPESFKMFMQTGDATHLRRAAETPKPPTPTEIEKLIAARNALPKGSADWKAINDRIEALNYRQPAASMNVSYGAPFTGVGPDGNPMLYQPSNRGGPPVPTGLAPPPQPPKDLPEAAAKQVTGARNLRDAIAKYKGALQNWDRFSVVSPAKVSEMDTLYNNMMLQAKEAYNLGVLNGPDYEIMTRVVTPPASLKGVMYGAPALTKQADTLSGIATSIERQVQATHPGRNPGAAPSGPSGGFPMLPAAKDFAGKTARDTQSGKRYRSDGTKWVEVQ